MYQDFKDLLSAFHAHGVRYLIVGGYAVSLHGQPRATKDPDCSSRPIPIQSSADRLAARRGMGFLWYLKQAGRGGNSWNSLRAGTKPSGLVSVCVGVEGVVN